MKTNRIFKRNYSVRPSLLSSLGYGFASEKIKDGEYKLAIILDENESVTFDNMIFISHDDAQNHIISDKLLNVSDDERNTIHLHTSKDEVLEYEVADGKLIAVGGSHFFTIGEVNHLENYVNLKAIEGKTVGEVFNIHCVWNENAHSDWEHEQGKAMYGFYYGGNSIDDCSNCGGGGCVHCSPKDYL